LMKEPMLVEPKPISLRNSKLLLSEPISLKSKIVIYECFLWLEWESECEKKINNCFDVIIVTLWDWDCVMPWWWWWSVTFKMEFGSYHLSYLTLFSTYLS
jgi:hypothetical protein